MRELVPAPNSWSDGRGFRRGDDSWAVVALQVNLNGLGNSLVLDGDLGPITEKVIVTFQRHRSMIVDGIAGAKTQERLCMDLLRRPELERSLPPNLLRGLTENESSFMVACYSPHPDGEGFDLGALQEAFYPVGTQLQYRDALTVATMGFKVATLIRAKYSEYRGAGAPARLAWECAALYHNRPASADRMAQGKSASTLTGPVAWVEEASGGRLHTIQEWCESYIERATKYVAWEGVR